MRSQFYMLLPLSIACGSTPIKTGGVGDNFTGGGQPNIQLEVEIINFGLLASGSMSTKTVVIYNVGDETLEISDITVTSPFTTPSSSALSVQPGTSTPVSVQYIASSFNDIEGTFTLTSNDPDDPQISLPIFASVITDADGDGYDSTEANGDDCNDSDPNIHPNAIDEWYDGIDSDCAQNDDYDQDGDGYQTVIWNSDANAGGGDCQDANDEMYPGAPDEWYDGVDSDCDGRDDFDQDGDGARSLAEGRGTDCNDFDPSVNSLATESLNGQDDNCDGFVDNNVAAWQSDLMYVGTTSGDQTGFHITAGDLNQDGSDDLIVGSPGYSSSRGHVAVFSGASLPSDGSNIEYAYNDFPGSSTSDQAGFFVGFYENFTGSGIPSLAVGSPNYNGNQGRVYFMDGDEAFYGGDLDDSYFTLTGSGSSKLGSGFSQDLDLNADGLDDLYGYYLNGSNAYVYLIYGGNHSGDITLNDVDARYATGGPADSMTRNFPTGGDLNGDGVDDALFCDGDVSQNFQNRQGAVWVLWGNTTQYSNNSPETLGSIDYTGNVNGAGDVILSGDNIHYSGEACAIGPDWNGDGMDEVWVFYPGTNGTYTGIYVIPGSPDLEGYTYHTRDVYSHYISTRPSNPISGFQNVGDWNGDGVSDMGVSFAQSSFDSSSDGGKAWLLSSDLAPGDHSGSDVAANIQGDDEQHQSKYGNSIVSRPTDLNGDGLIDWIASDWGYMGSGGSANNMGAIYINYNQSSQ